MEILTVNPTAIALANLATLRSFDVKTAVTATPDLREIRPLECVSKKNCAKNLSVDEMSVGHKVQSSLYNSHLILTRKMQ